MSRNCEVAFKEWASVIRAMERGDQTLLLRKGGISEEGGEFRVEHPEFLLFPTFEHQEVHLLQPSWRPLVPETIRSQDSKGRIIITSFARIEQIFIGGEIEVVRQLKDLYIWNDRYVEGRFQFQPDHPLYLLLLRVYRLSAPALINFRSEYGGCRSWITLDAPISLEGAAPAIPEDRFHSICADLEQRLGTAGIYSDEDLTLSISDTLEWSASPLTPSTAEQALP